jgi:hypothetical protein
VPRERPGPDPSEMTFLIGSKFLPAAEVTDVGIAAAARTVKATASPLDSPYAPSPVPCWVFARRASSRWNTVEVKKLRVFTSRHVMIARVGATSFGVPSMEASLFARTAPAPVSATRLLDRWFGPRVDNPSVKAYRPAYERLISAVHKSIVAASHEVDRSAATAARTGHKTKAVQEMEPNREAIANVLGQVAEWAARWVAFVTDEAAVAARLISEAREVLNNKVTPDDD